MSLIQKIKQEAINVGFIEKDATLIQLATEEACMNAYEYCHSAEVDNFTVTYLFSHQQCIIDIFHRGEIFEVRYTNEINYGLRGRGLQLITSIMDEVNVEQKGKNVHLVMVKKSTIRWYIKMMIQNLESIAILKWNEEVTLKCINQFEHALRLLLGKNSEHLIINFEGTEYMNSAGIGVLVDTVMRARKDHRQVILSNVESILMEILEIVKLEKFIKIFPTLEEAMNYYKEDGDMKGGNF
ncbi:MAG: STAS domain-containing protein [Bacillaceae bacterium]|nr:STAS domain-containing protein [Bacillaceae bacterium]